MSARRDLIAEYVPLTDNRTVEDPPQVEQAVRAAGVRL